MLGAEMLSSVEAGVVDEHGVEVTGFGLPQLCMGGWVSHEGG